MKTGRAKPSPRAGAHGRRQVKLTSRALGCHLRSRILRGKIRAEAGRYQSLLSARLLPQLPLARPATMAQALPLELKYNS